MRRDVDGFGTQEPVHEALVACEPRGDGVVQRHVLLPDTSGRISATDFQESVAQLDELGTELGRSLLPDA